MDGVQGSVDGRCQLCGEDNPNVLLTHHKLPRAFGGESSEENVATLCANCRQALTEMYGREFWERVSDSIESAPLGVEGEPGERPVVGGD